MLFTQDNYTVSTEAIQLSIFHHHTRYLYLVPEDSNFIRIRFNPTLYININLQKLLQLFSAATLNNLILLLHSLSLYSKKFNLFTLGNFSDFL